MDFPACTYKSKMLRKVRKFLRHRTPVRWRHLEALEEEAECQTGVEELHLCPGPGYPPGNHQAGGEGHQADQQR